MSTSEKRAEQRTVIKFCYDSGMTPQDTLKKIKQVENYKNVSRSLVHKLFSRFDEGKPAIEQMGRPPMQNMDNVRKVESAIQEDRRHTVRDLATITGCGNTTVHSILKTDLKMSKASARWVPRLLTVNEKLQRVTDSRMFILKCERDVNFLKKIITTDETWVHFFEPEDKRSSMVWKHCHSPSPKKPKLKVMCMVFADRDGILLTHMVPEGKTVNSNYYSKVLRRDLLNAIRKKRPALINEIENFVLHKDNAPPHTADTTELEIDVLGFQRVAHPPYSPDLAPLDFKYFPALKHYLRRQKFENRIEIMNAILAFNKTLNKEWFEEMFDSWLDRYRKCVAHGGEYFEKE